MPTATEDYTSVPTYLYTITNSNCSRDIDVARNYFSDTVNFIVTDVTIRDTISHGYTRTFSITPKIGLLPGVYIMTIRLDCECENDNPDIPLPIERQFFIRFKVHDSCNCGN
jgi:hypothetical protein